MPAARVLHRAAVRRARRPDPNERPSPKHFQSPRPRHCGGRAHAAGGVCPVGVDGRQFRSAAGLPGGREPGPAHLVHRHRLPGPLGDLPGRRALHDGYESRRRQLRRVRARLSAPGGVASRDVRLRQWQVRLSVRTALGQLQPPGLRRLRGRHLDRSEQLRRLRPRLQDGGDLLEGSVRLPERLRAVRYRVQESRLRQPELRKLRQEMRRAEE